MIDTVCKAWNIPIYEDGIEYYIGMEKLYLSAWFYLTKRFGLPIKGTYDNYKEAGVWWFKVKQYKIRLGLDSSSLEIMMFGESKKFRMASLKPAWIAKNRGFHKYNYINIHKLIIDLPSFNEEYAQKSYARLNKYCEDNNIDDNYCQEHFKKNFQDSFFAIVNEYNDTLFKIDFEYYEEKYKTDYSNSNIRHALRILYRFLIAMLEPISVRDCYYNIKGRVTDTELKSLPYSGIKYEFLANPFEKE